ncbi:MAG: glycoside hydrolase family 2 TIM barrel-domain containing protein [Spirochaetales bacterium]|nr:glycoside hydrolase family 2 TIM barrel-domain containing protein [Spirochaetales bacterium]
MNISANSVLDEWDFRKGDLGGIWEALRPVKKGSPEDALIWEKVNLPHCLNGIDSVDPDGEYYQGAGWYKREIQPANPYKQGRTILRFEGAGQVSDVYLDSEHLCRHNGGYDEWEVDLTPYLGKEEGSTYILSVRCSNGRDLEIIPSDLSDFNIYGGLYRMVHLCYEPAQYVENLRLIPLYNEEKEEGSLEVEIRFNDLPSLREVQISIIDPMGNKVIDEALPMKALEVSFTYEVPSVSPWSPSTPALYQCLVKWHEDGKEVCYESSFGFRSFRFEKQGPFYLNGKRLLLRGTHRHEDHAGAQAAQSPADIEKEMNLMKEMGANFIRLGHYQQSKQVLDLCDKLGILVWEEIPWCRGGLGGEKYQAMGIAMMENMIRQHYNHPSVIIWGLGNENDWPGDFSTFEEEEIRKFMAELHEVAHREDPNRKTAIRRCDFCKDIPDIYSPSIWAGWYRGHYREYKKSTLEHISRVDHFLHVEWGASTHAGRFSEDPYLGLENLKTGVGTDERANEASLYGGISRVSKDGNWSENYACDLFDWTLKEQLDMPTLTGTAFWPFKDFATPLRPENPVPKVNQKGVLQRDLSPKEAYYVVQSYWAEKPMVRLFGHDWTVRWGEEGEEKEIRAYSNCAEAELFLDGESLGKKQRDPSDFPGAGLRWAVPLKEGNHSLKVVATTGKGTIEDGYDFRYHSSGWGIPAKALPSFTSDEEGRRFWQIEVADEEGRRCLDFEGRVRFSAAGDSPLVTGQGTTTGSAVVECTNGKALIRLKESAKEAVLAASIEGLPLCTSPYLLAE